MGIEVGYDQINKGEKLYVKYPYKSIDKFLSKITKQVHENQTMMINAYSLSSTYSNKYAVKLKNFFYYNFSQSKDDLTNFNLEVSKKSKMIRMINFDISPIVKFTIGKLLSLKFGKYEANKEQCINSISNSKENNIYDFSNVFQSMVPHNRFCLSLNKHFGNHRVKASYSKIFNMEDNIKLTYNFFYRFGIAISNYFDMIISNDLIAKKSFVFNNKSKYGYHHITSGFHCISNLIDMTINDKERYISNGYSSFVRSVSKLRLENLAVFRDNELLQKFSPYAAVENFIIPSIENKFYSIFSLGLSIKIQNNFYLDFSLFTTASKNIKIKNKYINRFRIKLGN